MTSKSALDDVGCTPVAEESLMLVTPATVAEPDWQTLMALGFIDHPHGSHHRVLQKRMETVIAEARRWL